MLKVLNYFWVYNANALMLILYFFKSNLVLLLSLLFVFLLGYKEIQIKNEEYNIRDKRPIV